MTHDRWFARGFDRFLVFGADGGVYEADEPVWDEGRVAAGPLDPAASAPTLTPVRGRAGIARVSPAACPCRPRFSGLAVRRERARSRPDPTKACTVRTYSPKPGDVQRQWFVIDATDVVLGRLATQAATLLRGKHKPIFAPHVDTGDFVIIINAGKVALTGNKREEKIAYRHSGYPGGLRATPYTDLLEKHPEKAVEKAIKGMLPHNTLGRQMLQQAQGVRRPRAPPPGAAAGAVRDHPGRAVSAGRPPQTRREAERHRG